MLAETYGFGAKTVMVMDGNSLEHDLSQFLDASGELISDFPHPDTGPVPAAMRRRALAVPEASRWLLGGAALITLAGLAFRKRRLARSRSVRQTG